MYILPTKKGFAPQPPKNDENDENDVSHERRNPVAQNPVCTPLSERVVS